MHSWKQPNSQARTAGSQCLKPTYPRTGWNSCACRNTAICSRRGFRRPADVPGRALQDLEFGGEFTVRCLKKTGTLFDSAVACDFERGKRRFDSIRTRKLCQGLEAYRLFATAGVSGRVSGGAAIGIGPSGAMQMSLISFVCMAAGSGEFRRSL